MLLPPYDWLRNRLGFVRFFPCSATRTHILFLSFSSWAVEGGRHRHWKCYIINWISLYPPSPLPIADLVYFPVNPLAGDYLPNAPPHVHRITGSKIQISWSIRGNITIGKNDVYHRQRYTQRGMRISSHKVVLYGFVNNTAKTIEFGSIGYIDADDCHSHGLLNGRIFIFTIRPSRK